MKTVKGKAKRTTGKKSCPATRRAGGSDLLKIAKQMDPAIRKTAGRALFKSAGRDVIREFIFPDVEGIDAKGILSDNNEDRLIKTAQWLRDAGRCDDDSATFIIVASADSIYWGRCEKDVELERLDKKLRLIAEKQGITWPDDMHGWPDGWEGQDIPDEVQKIFDQYNKRLEEIWVEIFREYGEDKLADLWLKDQAEVWRRVARGREQTMGPPPKDLEKKLREAGIYPPAKGGGNTGSS